MSRRAPIFSTLATVPRNSVLISKPTRKVGIRSQKRRTRTLGTALARATSLDNDIERTFRESVQNLLAWHSTTQTAAPTN
jgi:hypothetical protein